MNCQRTSRTCHGAIVNGISLSKLRPFGVTFFIFNDSGYG
jgi:transketolase